MTRMEFLRFHLQHHWQQVENIKAAWFPQSQIVANSSGLVIYPKQSCFICIFGDLYHFLKLQSKFFKQVY